MKIEFNYGNDVLTLPKIAAETNGATAIDYKVLLLLAANPSAEPEELAAEAECDASEVKAAIGFWRGAGVIIAKESKKNVVKKANKQAEGPQSELPEEEKPLLPTRKLPNYTTAELTDLLEKRKEAKLLVDECQRSVGKMFSPQEVNTVLGLIDYLRLENEFVLELFAYCARNGKKSVRYIEKTAWNLHDEDVTTVKQLRDYIKRKDTAAEVESKLRQMLGFGERALTAKEKKYFEKWICDYAFSLEMIQKAYEITVDAGKSKIIDYMNGILDKWHAEGVDTLEKVDKRNAEHSVTTEKPHEGSFDTNDAFRSAVRRAFGDDFNLDIVNGDK